MSDLRKMQHESPAHLDDETPSTVEQPHAETGDAPDRITKMRKALEMVYEEHMHFGWGFDECHDAVIEALGGADFIEAWNRGVFGTHGEGLGASGLSPEAEESLTNKSEAKGQDT